MPDQTSTSMKDNGEWAVRPGVPADYAAVLAIQARAYSLKEVPLYGPDLPPLAETPQTLSTETTEGKQLLVGVLAGRVAASLRMCRLADGAAYFCRLSVDPDLQGRGLGQAMIRAFEEENADATEFRLDCGEKSAENLHIYEKLGYSPTGETFQVPGGPRVMAMRKRRT